MSCYGILFGDFWTKGSGKRLRGKPDAQVLATYLFSANASNMLGLYYLAVPAACHETGLDEQRFFEAMAVLSDPAIDIAYYDTEAELVWVPNMARYRVAKSLKAEDKRVLCIQRELERFRAHPFAAAFVRRYGEAFALGVAFVRGFEVAVDGPRKGPVGADRPPGRASDAPSKGLPAEPEGAPEGVNAAGPSPSKPDPDPLSDPGQKQTTLFPAAAAARPPAEVVLMFPTIRGARSGPEEWAFTEAEAAVLREGYPHLDVQGHVRAAWAYLMARPEKRKTAVRMMAFLTGWLGRRQDAGAGELRYATRPADQRPPALPGLCGFHAQAENAMRPTKHPRPDACSDCKHLVAAARTRASEPQSIGQLLEAAQ